MIFHLYLLLAMPSGRQSVPWILKSRPTELMARMNTTLASESGKNSRYPPGRPRSEVLPTTFSSVEKYA